MNIRLHVVVEGEEETSEALKLKLSKVQKKLSFSPSREQPSLFNCYEFYATADLTMEEIKTLKSQLNNDWEGEDDDCSAYGFNTKMLDPTMYYVQFQY